MLEIWKLIASLIWYYVVQVMQEILMQVNILLGHLTVNNLFAELLNPIRNWKTAILIGKWMTNTSFKDFGSRFGSNPFCCATGTGIFAIICWMQMW